MTEKLNKMKIAILSQIEKCSSAKTLLKLKNSLMKRFSSDFTKLINQA